MSFTDSTLYDWLYATLNSPPMGGIVVLAVGAVSMVAYGLTIRWIAHGRDAPEMETYAYPTSGLLEED